MVQNETIYHLYWLMKSMTRIQIKQNPWVKGDNNSRHLYDQSLFIRIVDALGIKG